MMQVNFNCLASIFDFDWKLFLILLIALALIVLIIKVPGSRIIAVIVMCGILAVTGLYATYYNFEYMNATGLTAGDIAQSFLASTNFTGIQTNTWKFDSLGFVATDNDFEHQVSAKLEPAPSINLTNNKYAFYVNDIKCQQNESSSNNIKSTFSYSFYDDNNKLISTQTLKITVYVYNNYSQLYLTTNAGSDGVKFWQSYLVKEGFTLSLKADTSSSDKVLNVNTETNPNEYVAGLLYTDTNEFIKWEELLYQGLIKVRNNSIIKGYFNPYDSSKGKCIIYTPIDIISIQSFAFKACSNITKIVIMGNGATIINDYSFSDCTNLKDITIGNGVLSICNGAFSGCYNVTNLKIGATLKNIDNCFPPIDNLERILVDENNVNFKSINNCLVNSDCSELFLGCKNSIIPNEVVKIGINAFASKYTSSISNILIPDTVKVISDYAFDSNTFLTNINLSENLTNIGTGAFSRCLSFSEIVIKNNINTISSHAFQMCENLVTVTIISNNVNIGYKAFENCAKLSTINFNGTKAQWNNNGYNFSYLTQKITVNCTDGVITIN